MANIRSCLETDDMQNVDSFLWIQLYDKGEFVSYSGSVVWNWD